MNYQNEPGRWIGGATSCHPSQLDSVVAGLTVRGCRVTSTSVQNFRYPEYDDYGRQTGVWDDTEVYITYECWETEAGRRKREQRETKAREAQEREQAKRNQEQANAREREHKRQLELDVAEGKRLRNTRRRLRMFLGGIALFSVVAVAALAIRGRLSPFPPGPSAPSGSLLSVLKQEAQPCRDSAGQAEGQSGCIIGWVAECKSDPPYQSSYDVYVVDHEGSVGSVPWGVYSMDQFPCNSVPKHKWLRIDYIVKTGPFTDGGNGYASSIEIEQYRPIEDPTS